MLSQEYLEISNKLEVHHALFYMMWTLGEPVFNNQIDTACVMFNEDGEVIAFEFNEEFWNKLTGYERSFIISHECLHVILNHGVRTVDTDNKEAANVALDIVVNHLLVNNFGFERSQISMADELCWVDTAFPGRDDIPDDESFEYYINLLEKQGEEGGGGLSGEGGPKVLDDHSTLANSNKGFEEVCKEINEVLSDEEKQGIKNTIDNHFQEDKNPSGGRGTEAGGIWTFSNVDAKKVKKKKKWETVIKEWALKFIKSEIREMEQWARTNRRFACLSEDLMIPTEMEIEDNEEEEQKIEVWFFQDTSYSCKGYIDRFFTAAASLPEDRFDIKMHCFDTSVYETTLESGKLYGFGETSFYILENYVQAYIKKHKVRYPEAVFVITDGYGDSINPEKPEKWYWFLTPHGYKTYIPKASHIFDLVDYEQ
jgi:predicted metal-dependent peptidase